MKIVDNDGFELVQYDPSSQKSVWKKNDGAEDIYRIDQPVTQLIEQNTAVRNEVGRAPMGDWVKVASLPANVVWNENLGLVDAFSAKDDKYISKFLNDSENRAWRTTEHKV